MPVAAICRLLRGLSPLVIAALAAHAPAADQARPLIEWHANSDSSARAPQVKLQVDRNVVRASHEADSPSQNEAAVEKRAAPVRGSRKLAPPSGRNALVELGKQPSDDALPFAMPRMESLTTAGAGLAIVVGLFLLCTWLFRRSGPKATTPLPKEAVAVLGRLPLAGNHFVHLLRLGSRLVLVSVGPDSVTTLAEVSEPNEVQHMLGLCMQGQQQSTSAEFEKVLEQLAKEPAQGFLEKNTAAAAYARTGRS